jgi:hypothetical protein
MLAVNRRYLMTSRCQPDLFLQDDPDLFEDQPAPVYRADPDEVRADLNRILTQARAAAAMPWPAKTVRLYQTIFPQMARWLPDDEAAQLCLAFESEMARLNAA